MNVKKKQILLLLTEGFEFYEASVFIDVIGWNEHEGNHLTKLHTCGPTKTVKSSFGHQIVVDYLFEELNIDEFDALAVPGGFEDFGFFKSAYREEYLSIIRAFNKENKIIASICTGSLPLAKSGVLKDRKATTYNINPERHKQLAEMGVKVVNEPIVIDGNIISSWNPSTALDVAFLLLEKLTSPEQKSIIQSLMGFKESKRV